MKLKVVKFFFSRFFGKSFFYEKTWKSEVSEENKKIQILDKKISYLIKKSEIVIVSKCKKFLGK
jgi:hypothetical protein